MALTGYLEVAPDAHVGHVLVLGQGAVRHAVAQLGAVHGEPQQRGRGSVVGARAERLCVRYGGW